VTLSIGTVMQNRRLSQICGLLKTNLSDALQVINNDQRRVLVQWLVLQLSLVILDFLALIFTAIVTSAFIPIIQSHPENIPEIFIRLYERFLPRVSIYEFIFTLVAISGTLVILRSLLSVLVSRHFFYKIAKFQVEISDRLIDSHFKASLESRLVLNQSQLLQTLTTSLNSLITYVLANIVIVTAELLSIFLLVASLIIYSPFMGFATGILGATYMLMLTVVILRSSTNANKTNALNELQAMEDLQVLSVTHLESRVIGSFDVLKNRYLKSRLNYSLSLAERQVQFQYPKVAMEIGAVILGLTLSIFVWYFFGIRQSVTFLALFAVLGFRIQPGVSRVQSCLLMVRQHLPSAQAIIRMNKFYSSNLSQHKVSPLSRLGAEGSSTSLVIQNLSYGILSEHMLIKNLDFKFTGPGLVLLKGPNGSGKSTLLEIMCGLREPLHGILSFKTHGEVSATENSANKIAYLPQEIAVFQGNLYENLTLGSEDAIDLKIAETILGNFDFLQGNWKITERRNYGNELSGGEKQKIGIARIFAQTSPIIILDEPSSALDVTSVGLLRTLVLERKANSLIIITSHTEEFDEIADAMFTL
jgi:ABC-type multidrug transport system fused ATPase/permease subunit